jgi:hypothetical protein
MKWERYNTDEFLKGSSSEYVALLTSVRKGKMSNQVSEVLGKL